MYTALLVDDEQAAHYAIEALLRGDNTVTLIGHAYNGKEAIELCNKLHPDLLFLDIHMPDMTGFEVLKQLTYRPYIIFCTAYDQYAIEAFNQNSIDYLLKPVDDKRFAQCMEKVERFIPKPPTIDINQLLELTKQLNPPKKATAIPIHLRSKITFIRCEEITYCVANDGYVSLFTDDGKEHLCNLTLKELQERLPDDFLRVQKSYIVHTQKIKEIQRYFNNRLILTMSDRNQTRITTGTNYIDTIRRELRLG